MRRPRDVRVFFHTFGCKANQYDTERMRQESQARGMVATKDLSSADVCVVNTCTVTNAADAEAKRFVRRVKRDNPQTHVVVAGCSAVLRSAEYAEMGGVASVVPGHDPGQVADSVVGLVSRGGDLIQLGMDRGLDRAHLEPIGAAILDRREGATRGWLKVQDGCDRKCTFCATRLARGASRSRSAADILVEAHALSRHHPELVLTGIHIGHYGRDLEDPSTLSVLLAGLLDAVPDVRFRLGSIEATEIDERLIDLIRTSGGRVAPHLHMPLQSGADPVLRRMKRWHTREAYRIRALEVAEVIPRIGLGADIITGFPGETEADHESTVRLVEELPFTYLHVFPFSPKDGTEASSLPNPVPQRVAGERSRELRTLAQEKESRYRASRAGEAARVTLEAKGLRALTEDYLRVKVGNAAGVGGGIDGPVLKDCGRLHTGVLRGSEHDLYIELDAASPQQSGWSTSAMESPGYSHLSSA
jgi:threonylcarbamoyladenosine tRNA methylthiotransferase MtaB